MYLTFEGKIVGAGGVDVTVNEKALGFPRSIATLSSDGFTWGSRCSGSTQLARAVVYRFAKENHILEPVDFVNDLGEDFRNAFIARIPTGKTWVITGEEIVSWLEGRKMTLIDSVPCRFEAGGMNEK